MGKSGKRTFTKANTRRYELVHRPRVDGDGASGTASDMVFRLVHQGPDVKTEERLAYRYEQPSLDEEYEDVEDEEYDYEQHLREIGKDPQAMFMEAEKLEDLRKEEEEGLARLREVNEDLDEVLRALDRDEAVNVEEELEDDFVGMANGDVEGRARNEPKLGRRSEPESRLLDEQFERLLLEEYEEDEDDDLEASDDEEVEREALDNVVSAYQAEEAEERGELDVSSGLARLCVDSSSEAVEEIEESEEEKWDCETILTTYSNLENHPRVIAEEKSDSRLPRKPTASRPVVSPTPTPQERENEGSTGNETISSVRRKGETKEEKRERKSKVKEERKARREVKSKLRSMFRDESRAQANAAAGIGNYKVRITL